MQGKRKRGIEAGVERTWVTEEKSQAGVGGTQKESGSFRCSHLESRGAQPASAGNLVESRVHHRSCLWWGCSQGRNDVIVFELWTAPTPCS